MNGKIEARLSALNRGEILHYLGYSGQKIDSTLSAQIDRCAALVTKAAVPRLVWVRLPMEHKTVFDWESRDLESLLDDCREHILLAATIGAGVDQLIHRYEISNMADAVIMDACASAAIENVCDHAEHHLREMLRKEGLYLTDRFSPGYGDLPMSAQRGICKRLDTGRKIGVMLSGSGLMIPRKSVTAIMGIAQRPVQRRARGCDICSLGADCPYRRAGTRCSVAR